MNSRKFGLFFVSLVLIISILACGSVSAGTGVQPGIVVQSVQPTYTLYPTQVLPVVAPRSSNAINAVLLDLGFYDDGYDCGEPCDSFTYDTGNTYVSAITYPNKSFTLSVYLEGDWDYGKQGEILAQVMVPIVGANASNWVAEHMVDAIYSDQHGNVDGYRLSMTTDMASKSLIIFIQP